LEAAGIAVPAKAPRLLIAVVNADDTWDTSEQLMPMLPVVKVSAGMVKGSFSKVLAEPRLLKLNFGIMCLHILLMSTFVALPGQLA
ncbi:hypothetical protein ONJ16_26570, partial [Salmonella enterica subsp. enterica serovar Montevideo]|nr:hypothetical protein [Salmonella enterica subsp. enterica serovar Montevideo]